MNPPAPSDPEDARSGEVPVTTPESPVVFVLRRLKRALRAVSPRLHDRLMGWYRRSGQIHQRLEVLKVVDRIDELAALVEEGRRRGIFEGAVADRLDAYVEELRREARAGS